MSDFTDKIKAEAEALSAVIDQELTVLEGVDGIDPLAPDDEDDEDNNAGPESTS